METGKKDPSASNKQLGENKTIMVEIKRMRKPIGPRALYCERFRKGEKCELGIFLAIDISLFDVTMPSSGNLLKSHRATIYSLTHTMIIANIQMYERFLKPAPPPPHSHNHLFILTCVVKMLRLLEVHSLRTCIPASE